MKDKNNMMIRRKIKKQSPKKFQIIDDQLSSPLITNEILLQKYPIYCPSDISSPNSAREEPGSMLEFLLHLENSNYCQFI
ncbi:unnamed protein product (macronuclear) [Paramecium tetraurelia]|uniref:Uncharacterized protein n=1 Tax=Paramecium tetraurelia TaxID=5888 RepID=A0CDB3_PARTE|nr:uncharacterized protein GSPATT00006991001 [Paramecium tetraurelia]CAK68780.1 unnamed protein product [Paramecium tetraurelia]|eukprot:XP_001436177.1 hypothetical protein (macronuclear) [Paramecium tetraurelia strain d4-2]